jgi:hypothetical protein
MAEPTTVPVVTQTKEPAGDITLPAGTFDGPVRKHLLYEVVNMQRANKRAGTHSTKTRGEVSGRRQEAVAAEGHRPRPRRQLALADLDRRRHHLRPEAARLLVPLAVQCAPQRAALGAGDAPA